MDDKSAILGFILATLFFMVLAFVFEGKTVPGTCSFSTDVEEGAHCEIKGQSLMQKLFY
jgi:hypothetical protein